LLHRKKNYAFMGTNIVRHLFSPGAQQHHFYCTFGSKPLTAEARFRMLG
jgi:hypothetical protein